jgi:hypothetical protein
LPEGTEGIAGKSKTVAAVAVVELKDAILHVIVERFGERTLDIETVERALSMVGFEIRQAAVFAPR